MGPETFATLRRELAAVARGAPSGPHTPDASHALHLQELLTEANNQLQVR